MESGRSRVLLIRADVELPFAPLSGVQLRQRQGQSVLDAVRLLEVVSDFFVHAPPQGVSAHPSDLHGQILPPSILLDSAVIGPIQIDAAITRSVFRRGIPDLETGDPATTAWCTVITHLPLQKPVWGVSPCFPPRPSAVCGSLSICPLLLHHAAKFQTCFLFHRFLFLELALYCSWRDQGRGKDGE